MNTRRVVRRLVLLLVFFATWAPHLVAQETGPVVVEGGTFRMGTPASTIAALKQRYGVGFPGVFEDEVPDHVVTLRSLRIDRYEVTNARFARFVATHPEWSRTGMSPRLHNGKYLQHWVDGRVPSELADHPVVFVTWHAAQAFCRADGGRLPTEAEWEYAARSGGDSEFPWGDGMPSPQLANYAAARIGTTVPTGRFPGNAAGVFDMAGNVWEFTLDAWGTYAAEPQTDPLAGGPVPADSTEVQGRRVLRGGSFGGAPVNLRTRWRDSHEVTNAVAFVGFRCAYPQN